MGFESKEEKLRDALDYPPNFEKAEQLLIEGADINAAYDEGNILSETLLGYGGVADDCSRDKSIACMEKRGNGCRKCCYKSEEIIPGKSMVDVVKWCLNHGFDVRADRGRYGAECLHALALSTFDEYILDAAKLLLDAGALNIELEDGETAKGTVGTDQYIYGISEQEYDFANLFEAYYQILDAADCGRDYSGIQYYAKAENQVIKHVFAIKDLEIDAIETRSVGDKIYTNSYYSTLCFELEDGFLLSSQYVDLWIDQYMPRGICEDVTNKFKQIVGSTISDIDFEARGGHTVHGREFYSPVIRISMDTGKQLIISNNINEIDKEEEQLAYFEIVIGTENE